MLQLRKFVMLFLSSMTLMFGCQEGEIDPNNPPQLILDTNELNIDGGGGDISVFYVVKNAVKGAKPEVVSGVDWVSLKEINSTAIVLNIAPSDVDSERFASISVKYVGMKTPVRINILQDRQILNKFKLEVKDVTYNSCTVKYLPVDKNMSYMANIIDIEYFKQTGTTDLTLFVAAEMENYRGIAERNRMTLEELMGRVSPQLIYTGDAERSFAGMKHGSQYIAYSYGVTFNGNEYTMTTPMHQILVELPMPNMYNVSFNISSYMDGNMAFINIVPENWSGYYNVFIVPNDSVYYIEQGGAIYDSLTRNLASKFYDNARKAMLNGATAEQFMRSSCYKGEQNINLTLEAGKRYMVYVFAVESKEGEIPVIRSVPSYHHL